MINRLFRLLIATALTVPAAARGAGDVQTLEACLDRARLHCLIDETAREVGLMYRHGWHRR